MVYDKKCTPYVKGISMDKRFYTGLITIDEQMAIRNADEGFYKFSGQDIYAPVSQSIHPDDLHRVKEAMEELKAGRLSDNMVSVRLKRYDGQYCWVSIKLSLEAFEHEGMKLFAFRFTDLASGEDYSTALGQLKNEYEVLLSMQNCIVVAYAMWENTLRILRQCSTQRMPLFTGTIAEWHAELQGKMDPSSEKEFDIFCKELEEGKREIKHHIVTSAFSSDDTMEEYDIKCQLIQHTPVKCKILGRMIPCAQAKAEDSDNGFVMDAGLPILNKKAITEYAQRLMTASDNRVYLAILDLDNFKTVNDTFGHLYGDEVLLKTSEIIKENLGDYGMVGRIGGDEMMLVLTKVENQTELRNILRSIRMNIAWAYKENEENLQITCSIGVATYPDHGYCYEDVFKLADKMLYIAKKKGKNRYVIYIPEIHDAPAEITLDAAGNNPELFREDKVGVMQRLVEHFLMKQVVTYESVLTEIGYAFELDEIIMIYGDMKVSTTWTPQGTLNDAESGVFLQPEEGFAESFDANGVFAVNGIFNLEAKMPQLASALVEKGIASALFYQMRRKDKMIGYFMFAKKKHRQMWSESDETLLAVVGKAIELSLVEK